MDKYSNPDVFIVLGGFVAIILLGAFLAEVAVFIAKILGYEENKYWHDKRSTY